MDTPEVDRLRQEFEDFKDRMKLFASQVSAMAAGQYTNVFSWDDVQLLLELEADLYDDPAKE